MLGKQKNKNVEILIKWETLTVFHDSEKSLANVIELVMDACNCLVDMLLSHL